MQKLSQISTVKSTGSSEADNVLERCSEKIQAMSIKPTGSLKIKAPSNNKVFDELEDPKIRQQLKEQIEANHKSYRAKTRFQHSFAGGMDLDMQAEWKELEKMSDENIMSSYNLLSFREARQYKAEVNFFSRLQCWRQFINARRVAEGHPPLLETWRYWNSVPPHLQNAKGMKMTASTGK